MRASAESPPMLCARFLLRPSLLLALVAVALLPHAALAREIRPDSLDRQIDAIPAARLLALPIAQLLDPARTAAAHHLLWVRPYAWLAMVLFEFAAMLYLWSSGAAAHWRDALRRRIADERLVRMIFGALLGLCVRVAALIPTYAQYRVDRSLGRADILGAHWLAIWSVGTLAAMLLAGATIAVVLELVDRTHRWYLPTIVLFILASVLGSYLYPFAVVPVLWPGARHSVRLSSENARLAAAGLPVIPVLRADADFAGLKDRVVLVGLLGSREMLAANGVLRGYSQSERAFLLARNNAQLKNDALVIRLAVELTLVLVGVALAVIIAERIGVRRDDDPLSRIALLAALLVLAYAAIAPADLAVRRSMVMRSDRAALAMTHDRAAAIGALVRQGDHRVESLCPTPLSALLVAERPPLGSRIARIEGAPDPCEKNKLARGNPPHLSRRSGLTHS